MEDHMTQAELYLMLQLLADNVEAKAKDAKDAAAPIRTKAEQVK